MPTRLSGGAVTDSGGGPWEPKLWHVGPSSCRHTHSPLTPHLPSPAMHSKHTPVKWAQRDSSGRAAQHREWCEDSAGKQEVECARRLREHKHGSQSGASALHVCIQIHTDIKTDRYTAKQKHKYTHMHTQTYRYIHAETRRPTHTQVNTWT